MTGVGYGLHVESDRPGTPLGAVVGIAGRYGRPGFLGAYDAATGKKVWQFDTTQEGWEGAFTAETGRTPARAVERLRVDAARAALDSGARSLQQVARDCGFGSADRMRRAFQRLLGQPPSGSRRAARRPAGT